MKHINNWFKNLYWKRFFFFSPNDYNDKIILRRIFIHLTSIFKKLLSQLTVLLVCYFGEEEFYELSFNAGLRWVVETWGS